MRGQWRRNIVDRERYAGDDLRHKEKQQRRSEHVRQARTTGYGLVERRAEQCVRAGAAVEPAPDSRRPSGGGIHGFRVCLGLIRVTGVGQLVTSLFGTSGRKV